MGGIPGFGFPHSNNSPYGQTRPYGHSQQASHTPQQYTGSQHQRNNLNRSTGDVFTTTMGLDNTLGTPQNNMSGIGTVGGMALPSIPKGSADSLYDKFLARAKKKGITLRDTISETIFGVNPKHPNWMAFYNKVCVRDEKPVKVAKPEGFTFASYDEESE